MGFLLKKTRAAVAADGGRNSKIGLRFIYQGGQSRRAAVRVCAETCPDASATSYFPTFLLSYFPTFFFSLVSSLERNLQI